MNLAIRIQNRFFPQNLWRVLSKQFQKKFNQSHLILSFDCDTEEDIDVALEVHKKLQDFGVTPVYAIPGELLLKGKNVYTKIFESGAEFINHGGRSHTYFDTIANRHKSNFFYDQQTESTLCEDIFLGHETLQKVLGITAQGWRTPHFGTFQGKGHFEFLFSILNQLDYKFSTSTIPEKGLMKGPFYSESGIWEIPVTGIFSHPMNIMDTWAFFGAPDKVHSSKDYYNTGLDLAEFSEKEPLLINIYGDPSHIYDQPYFFKTIKRLAEVATPTNYNTLVERINETKSNSR